VNARRSNNDDDDDDRECQLQLHLS
jgi:hypothetical protein